MTTAGQPIDSPAADSAIWTRGLRKAFGSLRAVDGLSLEVKRGEIFGLVGPDGAGKTTTMRLLTGILDADGGEAVVDGYDVFRQAEVMKRQIGYMPQQFSIYGDLTVGENLFFYAGIYHVPHASRRKREQELLEFSRLGPFYDRLAGNLSGGMKQKLTLACTLMHTPHVLFLDEPTAGVDPVSRRDFWQILYSLLAQGVTILVSTPYMDEAERCNRIAMMNKGRTVITDTPDHLRSHMRGELLAITATPQRAARDVLAPLPQVHGVTVFGNQLHLLVADACADEPIIRAALARQGVQVSEVRQMAPGLEDVFISLLGEEHE